MIPTLKVPQGKLKENNFINGYLSDELSDLNYENSVYLLFKPTNILKFKEFLDNEYERTESVIEDYDYPNGFVVVVYELNSVFRRDFYLIKKGNYSKTSKDFQELFAENIEIKQNNLIRKEKSLQYRIFNKTQDLVDFWENRLSIDWDDDFEVWEGWEEKKEILNINNIK